MDHVTYLEEQLRDAAEGIARELARTIPAGDEHGHRAQNYWLGYYRGKQAAIVAMLDKMEHDAAHTYLRME